MSLLEVINDVKSKDEIRNLLTQLKVGSLCVARDKDIILVVAVRLYRVTEVYPVRINEEDYTEQGEYIMNSDPTYEHNRDIVNVVLCDNYMFYNW